jgi:hypothetical protein
MPNEFRSGIFFITPAMSFLVIQIVLSEFTTTARRRYAPIVAVTVALHGPTSPRELTQRSM